MTSMRMNPEPPSGTWCLSIQERLALALLQRALDGLEGASLGESEAWAILDQNGFPRPHTTIHHLEALGFITRGA